MAVFPFRISNALVPLTGRARHEEIPVTKPKKPDRQDKDLSCYFFKWLSRYFGLEALNSMHSKCHIMLYSSGIHPCLLIHHFDH